MNLGERKREGRKGKKTGGREGIRVRRLELREGEEKGETAKEGRIDKKNSDRGAVVLSGVRLWNSISWSVDWSPRW